MLRRKRLCLLCFQFSDHTRRCVCGKFYCNRCGSSLCIDCLVKSIVSQDEPLYHL